MSLNVGIISYIIIKKMETTQKIFILYNKYFEKGNTYSARKKHLTVMSYDVIIQEQDRQLECLLDVDALGRFEMRCSVESYDGCMFTKTRIG